MLRYVSNKNPSVLSCGCRLTEIGLHSGSKMVACCVHYSLQGFYCGTEDEFDNLCQNVRRHFMSTDERTPMFEVHEHKLPVDVSILTAPLTGLIKYYIF